jgi:hypothetical protein
MVVTIMWPVSVLFPSTTVASKSYREKKINITFHPSEAREGGREGRRVGGITFSSLIFISFISSGSLSIAMLLPPPGFFMLAVGAILTEAISDSKLR